MKQIDININPEIYNAWFPEFFRCRSRWLVNVGGANSGKSVGAAQKTLFRLLKEENQKFLIGRKTFHSHRHSTFALFKNLIYQYGLSPLFSISNSTLEINCTNGNSIIFVGYDDVEKLKSIVDITGTWLEEPTENTADDIIQTNLRMRGKTTSYKQNILTLNPINEYHYINTYFCKNYTAPDNNLTVLHTTHLDNKFADEVDREQLRRLEFEDPTYYKIYTLGEWATVRGLIYTNWMSDTVEPKSYQDVIYGLDFGFTNHPTALVKVLHDNDDLYCHELLYQTHLTTPELISKLKSFSIGNTPIYCDSAEPKTIKELHDAGFNALPADKDVKNGIEFVKRYTIHVLPGSPNLEEELKSYKWKEIHDIVINEPVKFRDHLLDALRYAVFTYGQQYWSDSVINFKTGKLNLNKRFNMKQQLKGF